MSSGRTLAGFVRQRRADLLLAFAARLDRLREEALSRATTPGWDAEEDVVAFFTACRMAADDHCRRYREAR